MPILDTIDRAQAPVGTAEAPITVESGTDGTEWDAFVHRHPLATVDHLWPWRKVFRDVFGHDSEYLVARRNGDIVGVLPLVLFRSRLFGRQLVSLPMLNYGGLLLQDPAAATPLVARATELAREFGARHVELRHALRTTQLPRRQHKVSIRLELPAAADALWAGLDRKVRNQVRKGQKSTLDVISGGSELVDSFYRVFARNMRDLGTPVYPKRLFAKVLEVFGPRARIFIVDYRSRPVAGAVMLRFRDTALVPWASSLREVRHLCANMLLYWSMIEASIADGMRIFDFGRSSPDGGTYPFKLQWGARPEPQSWEYVLLRDSALPEQGPSSGRFNAAIEIWKRLPVPIANALGPRVVRHIP